MKNIIPFFAVGLSVLLSGCANDASQAPTPGAGSGSAAEVAIPIEVVCTTNIIKDLVQQIGGDRVTVTAIMDGPGVDPHSYTPSPKDTNALAAADLVVYSGLHLEGRLHDALHSLEHRGVPVICVTDGIRKEEDSRLIQTEEGVADPHVWFDPDLWSSCGQWLAAELSKFDAAGKDEYEAAAEAFAKSMADTKEKGVAIIAPIPRERRVLVTAHDAFAYFARAFDFDVQAVQGISTESEPGVRRVNELVEILVSQKISAVFTEQSVSEKNIQALVAGCKASGHDLVIGAKLFSDTAGANGTEEETLSGALLYNIQQIADALTVEGASE